MRWPRFKITAVVRDSVAACDDSPGRWSMEEEEEERTEATFAPRTSGAQNPPASG